jgi:hypothetical protein
MTDTQLSRFTWIPKSVSLGNSKNKKIALTLLVHPEWLRGSPGKDANGNWFGGSVTDSAESTAAWNKERAKTLLLIEVRGELPAKVICPDTGEVFYTDKHGGTVPRKSTFTCKEATCGKDQDVLTAIKRLGRSGPMAMYAIHGYCPDCDRQDRAYGGRFFDTPDIMPYDAAYREWQSRRETDLTAFWPRSEIPYGFMTHQNNGGIPNHGFTHWWTMFNPRQLLVLSNLIRRIIFADDVSHHIREFVLGAFLQYVRYQNMFVIWQIHRDCLAPHFSNNNYHPKANVVENGVFSDVGSGNWSSCIQTALDGIAWASDPWEIVSTAHLEQTCREAASQITGKGYRITCADPVPATGVLDCRSATDLCILENNSYDLVITDPPFGGLLHYAELADFFHVWLRLGLKDKYPEISTLSSSLLNSLRRP